jgi:hypothetical protein
MCRRGAEHIGRREQRNRSSSVLAGETPELRRRAGTVSRPQFDVHGRGDQCADPADLFSTPMVGFVTADDDRFNYRFKRD